MDVAGDRAAERRRDRVDDEARRPFRGDDVLEEVDRQQVVERDRVQRRDVDDQQQDEREVEGDAAPRVRRPAPLDPVVGGRE
jgi:hypothetical protein